MRPDSFGACLVRPIAASEVEGWVLGQVRRLLASPDLVARVTEVRQKNFSGESAARGAQDHRALAALEPIWDELYPDEQARIFRLLIERIDVASDGVSVTLHAAAIRRLVMELRAKAKGILTASVRTRYPRLSTNDTAAPGLCN